MSEAADRRPTALTSAWTALVSLLPVLALPGCVSEPGRRMTPLEVQATVDGMRPSDVETRGPLVVGLTGMRHEPVDRGSRDEASVQDPQDPQGGQSRGELEAHLRSVFGPSILIGEDGRVTKQYFLVGDLGPTFLKLVSEITPDAVPPEDPPPPPPGTKVGGPQSRSILGQMLRGREIEVTYLKSFEKLTGARIVDDPRPNQPSAVTGQQLPIDPNSATPVALLLVTASSAALTAFEGALDLFYTSIPQVEIAVNVVEYSNADALAFGVTRVGLDSSPPSPIPNLRNLSSSQLVQEYTSIFPLRQPIVGASPVTDVGLFTLGGIHDSWNLNVVLQALEANNLADITSSPKLVVRNGGVASISTLTQFPFPKAKINQLGSQVATDIEFKPVGVKMNIVPVIAGKDTVLLQIYADVSAVTGFANTEPVVTPITSTRTAVTTVYLKNNHSLLIGGLKSVTMFQSETKVPILGDIPLLGFLFRSTSTSRQETSVAFQITPRIVNDRGVIAERDEL
ncbi:MAG: type II secretion system protein GspD [Planctomycetota bacterium]